MGLSGAIIVAGITFILLEATISGYEINFTSFDVNRDTSKFLMLGTTITPEGPALELTPDTGNRQFSLSNKSGRALLNRRFRIYNDRNKVASFNSSFVFNIRVENGGGGEGLAFLITSCNYLPANSYGQWLGLFDGTTYGNNNSMVVAVEFDTCQSPATNDPDDNHVGLNVDSINSTILKSLDRNQINLKGHYNIQAWIQYDGKIKKMDVYVGNESETMPSEPLFSSFIDLSSGVLGTEAYFGFSASTGVETELNCLKSWNFTIESDSVSVPNRSLIIALSVCLSFVFVAVILLILVLIKYRKSHVEAESKLFDELDQIPGHIREFRYKDLKKATNNFNPAALLGRGGFGTVYKGILPKGKGMVAVKRMTKDYKEGKGEFISEISVINRLRHRNLVPLLGWCHENRELILVYEYMPNGSLDQHIFTDGISRRFLDWEQRYNIVSGVASALLYLHQECEQRVIHRDVKASNIMLDSEYNARLGDFGLARLFEHNRISFTSTGIAGTMGYIAPECFHTGRPTAESDVFSFGAVVLEVTCGRCPRSSGLEATDLVGWVWQLYRQNEPLKATDRHLASFGSVNINEEDIKRLLVLGLACSNPVPEARPTMRDVTQILARTMPPPSIPLFRPAFVWSHTPSNVSFTSTSTGSPISSINPDYSYRSFKWRRDREVICNVSLTSPL